MESPTGALPTVLEVVALWFLISVPVYVTASRARVRVPGLFGQSLGATVMGGAAYEAVVVSASVLYGAIIGEGQTVAIYALSGAAVVWLVFFHSSLRLRWPVALATSALASILFIGLGWLLGDLLGLSLPALFQFPL